MWLPTLCILFSILGASVAQDDIPQHGVGISSPETIAEEIVEKITKTIQTKDPKMISGSFEKNFTFHSCIGDLNQNKFIELLTQIPSKPRFDFISKYTKYVGTKIRFFVTAYGLTLTPGVTSEFMLTPHGHDYKLSEGSIISCSGYRNQNTTDVALKFLDKWANAIRSKNETLISELFAPDFTFKLCKMEWNKEMFVSVLKQLPAYASSLSSYLFASNDHGSFIEFTASISRFNRSEVIVTFYLDTKDQKLGHMFEASCLTS
uniref:DUF4783 domain-containing protein n=1 Tax=Caenorhabditis tropicalis TaxID=1561998 RepID=A0A1I7UPK2_9PELO